MLDESVITRLAQRLDDAERNKAQIRMFTQEYPELGLDDAYAIQRAWTKLKIDRGRGIKGHKIGLTSRAMQAAVGIDEPDHGVLFDDMFYFDGAQIPAERFYAPRIEVELAFVLRTELRGPDCTIFDVLRCDILRLARSRNLGVAHAARRPSNQRNAEGPRHHLG